MIQIERGEVSFNSFEGSGPRTRNAEVDFSGPVNQATAVLTGFNAAFTKSDGNHYLGNLEIHLDSEIDEDVARRVNVTVTFGLRDWSGEWDDKYEGTIKFAVIAELAP